VYRYTLGRRWDNCQDYVLWIMLNPSTADASVNDPTIKKCMGFAEAWGYHGIEVRNLFAYRTAYPKELLAAKKAGTDVVGAENDRFLLEAITDSNAGLIVGGWGANVIAAPVGKAVKQIISEEGRTLMCVDRHPNDTFPRHPLYLSYEADLDVCP
jgi:hypothetical protein